MPDRWNIYNETIGNIISEARSLTSTEIISVRSQLMDLYNNKKRIKEPQFSTSERIRLIHPHSLRGKILIYLLRSTKWENNSFLFTRKKIADVNSKKQSQISTATKKLIQLGLVSTHREFFPKTRKFRNIYNLTISGVYAAKWLIKQKKEEKKWKKNGYNNTKKN